MSKLYDDILRHVAGDSELANGKPVRRAEAEARALLEYIQSHPQQRFWQALRNWSGYTFVGVSNSTSFPPEYRDSFYLEDALCKN